MSKQEVDHVNCQARLDGSNWMSVFPFDSNELGRLGLACSSTALPLPSVRFQIKDLVCVTLTRKATRVHRRFKSSFSVSTGWNYTFANVE